MFFIWIFLQINWFLFQSLKICKRHSAFSPLISSLSSKSFLTPHLFPLLLTAKGCLKPFNPSMSQWWKYMGGIYHQCRGVCPCCSFLSHTFPLVSCGSSMDCISSPVPGKPLTSPLFAYCGIPSAVSHSLFSLPVWNFLPILK